jgi:hypothetical protein
MVSDGFPDETSCFTTTITSLGTFNENAKDGQIWVGGQSWSSLLQDRPLSEGHTPRSRNLLISVVHHLHDAGGITLVVVGEMDDFRGSFLNHCDPSADASVRGNKTYLSFFFTEPEEKGGIAKALTALSLVLKLRG